MTCFLTVCDKLSVLVIPAQGLSDNHTVHSDEIRKISSRHFIMARFMSLHLLRNWLPNLRSITPDQEVDNTEEAPRNARQSSQHPYNL